MLLTVLVVFVAVVSIQLIYWIIFLVSLNKKELAGAASGAPVSIIVCAHDEEENLKALIPQLLAQDYPEFEVIIVNDRSNDGTYDLLLEETKKDYRLKMVNVKDTPPHVNSKKYALTLGIRAAVNEWVLLTDADCKPASAHWVSSMSECFTNETQFVLGFSPYLTLPGFLNCFIRFESILTAIQYLSFALLKNPYMGVGRNLAYRKSLFLEKKGFNNYLHVTGGDDDLFVNLHANKVNTRVRFDANSLTLSNPETTWKGFFYQKVRHLSVGKRYRLGHKFLIGLFHASWLLTWLTGLSLLILSFIDYRFAIIAAVGIILRWIFQIFGINTLLKKSGLKFSLWIVPVLDFLYPIYYISTGLVALLTKKVRWKN